MQLEPFADDVWTVAAPQTFFGLHLGTRMTVARLPDRSLWIHSPIAPSAALRAEIDALGPVGHIVCPNVYHHLYAGSMAQAYPSARLYGPPELARKRPDLAFDGLFGADFDRAGFPGLARVKIDGSLLHESVFVHGPSRTLISSDLTENFATSDHTLTRWYLKAGGIHGRVGWSRLMRVVYRDRRAARRAVDALLEHDFDRVIIAHGRPITDAAKDAVRTTFAWL